MAGRPKLLTRPPRTAQLLARPRLLAAAGDTPVVIVAAPEGSGCSAAAAQIAEAAAGQVAWCRLADGYDTALDVIEMVAATLEVEVTPARRVVELADQLLDLFDAGPLTVVVDDHHLGSDGDLDRVIAECVDLLHDDARIIVAASARPAGLIGLLAPARRVLLGPSELAFDAEEAAALFELHGAPALSAERWRVELSGWADGVAAGAHAPEGDPAHHVAELLGALVDLDPCGGGLVDLAAASTYVTVPLATELGLSVTASALADLAAASPLLDDHDGYVRLSETAAVTHRSTMDAADVRRLRREAGAVLAGDDPTTAIDLLLEADAADEAADVLADHLSEIGVERALTWLYRLPPELRRRFPPVLAAGQATVEVDVALADAETRLRAATTDRSRREALLALGSVEAHRGELAAAAAAFEAAARAANEDAAAAGRIAAELASTRWLLGDLLGARAALADAPSTSANRWLGAQLDAVEGKRPGRAAVSSDDAHDLSVAALGALVDGDDAAAEQYSTAAYLASVEAGGEAFVAASAVRGWALLRSGAFDDVIVLAESVERRLGPRHQLARVHGAILRERCSRAGSDTSRHERDQRRLRDLRARGYASIERLVTRLLDGDEPTSTDEDPLVVRVLGDHEVRCDGRTIRRSEWKSKKALEVLTVLASHGPSGARREQVIESVWPDREPEKGRTLLRTALSEIRRRLEPDRPAGEASRHLTTREEVVAVDGRLDLDVADELVGTDPVAAFTALRPGLAPEVEAAEWAQDWAGRIERLVVTAAATVAARGDLAERIEAFEALIGAEPWQRAHFDALAVLHREAGDEVAAAEVERRWFADD